MNTNPRTQSFPNPVTLPDLLRWRAVFTPEQQAFTFLTYDETHAGGQATETHLTYGALDKSARGIAGMLQRRGLAGERVVLIYPPGPALIAGFWGCLYAGAIAVPAYPPDPARPSHTLPRLQAMVTDAQAKAALTVTPIIPMAQALARQVPDLAALEWLATDNVTDDERLAWHEPRAAGDTLAFLQYTSGSTRAPRGAMLSHANLLHNCALIQQVFDLTPESVTALWLPPYHDMGLIGGIIQPVYTGMRCVLMSPLSFLQQPLRWLQAIVHYQATISGGPDFAYDLCVYKIPPEQRATLDLSHWALAFDGSEPVHKETLDRFAAAFASCGFKHEAFHPAYGLAEATLLVSGGMKDVQPAFHTVQRSALEHHRVVRAVEGERGAHTLVGCGHPLQEVIIVQPQSLSLCPPDEVGEIWVTSPSVAQGYWNRPDESAQVFRAHLPGAEKSYLRTGDLGFLHDSELYVTGRVKDLIIVRGRNHYPQDIEATVERSHRALKPGGCATFTVELEGLAGEHLVVVQEVDTGQTLDVDEIVGRIRQAVADVHEISVYAVALIKPGSLPKTASNKIQRHACRAGFLNGTLDIVGSSIPRDLEPGSEAPPLTRQILLDTAPHERITLLNAHVVERVAHALRVAPSQLNPDQPLSSLGLDSITLVDLLGELETEWSVHLAPSDLLQDMTIVDLANQLLTELTTPSVAHAYGEIVTQYPLSHGQRALWFLCQLTPGSGAYNIVQAARVRAVMDVQAMQRVFEKLADYHPTLRTTFTAPDGKPIQRVYEHMGGIFQHVDASAWSEEQLKERLAEEAYRPFDLERGPLMRVTEFTRSPQDHIMVLSIHHLVSDLWSVAVILQGMGALYAAEKAGVSVALKPLRAQYADYILEQEEMLAGPDGERLWAYWSGQLSGELPPLNLPTDRARLPVQTNRGTSQTIRLGKELSLHIQSLARSLGVSAHVVTLAAFQALLYHYSGQEDFLVGCPKAGRTQKWARLVGYFVNPVAIRADLSANPTFAQLVERVRNTLEPAFEHDAYPFALLVERLQPARDLSRSPIFQVMFSWQKTTRMLEGQSMTSLALGVEGKGIELGGLPFEAYPLEQRAVPFDLSLLIAELNDEFVALMEYNMDLFDAGTINRMLGHLQALLQSAVDNPGTPVAALPLLTVTERQQLMVTWNAHKSGEPQAQSVHRQFEMQAERTPDAIAVTLGQDSLTYRELNQRANQLACHLQTCGVGPEKIVSLCVGRSIDMIVGLLGILKSGAAYLPLDPTYPVERMAFMLKDSGAHLVLTQQRFLERLPTPGMRVVCLDTGWDNAAEADETNLTSSAAPDQLAYVLYTSGSTGEPKGVLITHGALANHCRDIQRYYHIAPCDRVLQFANLNFDASLEQIFTALSAGATLVLRDSDVLDAWRFNQMISDVGITVVNIPPAYWHQWAKGCAESSGWPANPQLRLVIVGGDVMLRESLALWERTPMHTATLFNAYGPTETTITATLFEVPTGVDTTITQHWIPIGRPLVNRTAYILNNLGQPVPIGVPGELHLGGAGLARGYLHRPELTAERFIPDPFSQEIGARLYKTGDLARYLPDGNIEILGRLDSQVKIRGIRIETGEVEATLAQHPDVRQAFVTVCDSTNPADTNQRLVAYIAPHPGRTPASSELLAFSSTRLPAHMVPTVFMLLDALPQTASGKVDRRALPEPDLSRPDMQSCYVAPRTPVEAELAGIFAGLLGVERVGIHDHFFKLGGHSLLATQLVSRVRESYGVELPLRRVFEMPTVAALAVALTQLQAAQAGAEEVEKILTDLERLPEEEAHSILASRAIPG